MHYSDEEPKSKKFKESPESEDDMSDVDEPDEYEVDKEQVGRNQGNDKSTEVDKTSIKANFFAEELTSDDEILTFQCPKNFNLKTLLDRGLDLGKTTKIKDGTNKYRCQIVTNQKKTLTCVLPSLKDSATVKKIPVVGHILVRQCLKIPHKHVDCVAELNKSKKFPKIRESTQRHPLLGSDWDSHISQVTKRIKRHKKLLKKSLKHEKILVKAEKERKEQKKKLKVELSLLQKKKN